MSGNGRIASTQAVVLSRRDYRETDRVALLYTQEYGKLPVRFIGVNRPRAKLKALSEPMVWAEYRLHVRPGAEFGTVVGGALVSTFPTLRSGLEGTFRGLEACELLERLTPNWQPSATKFELITRSLELMEERGPNAWLSIAYGLRLLDAAGFGGEERRVSGGNRPLWEGLHSAELSELYSLPDDEQRQARLEDFIARSVAGLTDRPLRAAALRRKIVPGTYHLTTPLPPGEKNRRFNL